MKKQIRSGVFVYDLEEVFKEIRDCIQRGGRIKICADISINRYVWFSELEMYYYEAQYRGNVVVEICLLLDQAKKLAPHIPFINEIVQ